MTEVNFILSHSLTTLNGKGGFLNSDEVGILILTTELTIARLWEILRFMPGTDGHWNTECLYFGKVGEVSHSDSRRGEPREAAPPRRESQDSPQHSGREYLKR